MSEKIKKQIICITHESGALNENSTQHIEHQKNNQGCKWEEYNPKIHLKNYSKTKIKKTNDDEELNSIEKIYEFAKEKIRKIVVSKTDNNQVFVLFDNYGKLESLEIGSSRARCWLKSAYHKTTDRIYSDD